MFLWIYVVIPQSLPRELSNREIDHFQPFRKDIGYRWSRTSQNLRGFSPSVGIWFIYIHMWPAATRVLFRERKRENTGRRFDVRFLAMDDVNVTWNTGLAISVFLFLLDGSSTVFTFLKHTNENTGFKCSLLSVPLSKEPFRPEFEPMDITLLCRNRRVDLRRSAWHEWR